MSFEIYVADSKKLVNRFVNFKQNGEGVKDDYILMDLLKGDKKLNSRYQYRIWIAMSFGECMGKVAAFIDDNFQTSLNDEKMGFISHFDCCEDSEMAHALLMKAVGFLKVRGVEKVYGPVPFSICKEAGLKVRVMSELSSNRRSNYIKKIYRESGFCNFNETNYCNVGLVQYRDSLLKKITAEVGLSQIEVKSFSTSKWSELINDFLVVKNQCNKLSFSEVTYSESEFEKEVLKIKNISSLEFIKIAYFRKSPVGCLFAELGHDKNAAPLRVIKRLFNSSLFDVSSVKIRDFMVLDSTHKDQIQLSLINSLLGTMSQYQIKQDIPILWNDATGLKSQQVVESYELFAKEIA
ncbi:MAG: hypothetical protein HOE90_16665 [Bacteriovoracaceae bacterium]|jgi:hypothetical protein|nr:hypothetical protein [Bacteriovoracaceae bacterium]